MSATRRGYMRTRNEQGTFDIFFPKTESGQVIVDKDTNESLDDRLTTIKDHIDKGPHITPELRDKWNGAHSELTTSTSEVVTVKPGVQKVTSKRSTNVKLGTIKGKVLNNLLGPTGGCEDVALWTGLESTIAVDKNNRVEGVSSIKITLASSITTGAAITQKRLTFNASKYYILLGQLKCGTCDGVNLYVSGGTPNTASSTVTSKTKFTLAYSRFTGVEAVGAIASRVFGTAGQTGYVDAVRVYEITKAEYDALPQMTNEEVDIKYPFVYGLQPVKNPYIIRYGENLCPSFYDAIAVAPKLTVKGHYEAVVNMSGSDAAQAVLVSNPLPLIPGETYTLSAEVYRDGVLHFDDLLIDLYNDVDGLDTTGTHGNKYDTFTVPSNVTWATVRIVIPNPGRAGVYTVKNVMLTLGTEVVPFKPREDAILALPTKLFADVDGTDADEVYFKDDYYVKLRKWKYFELNEDYTYTYWKGQTAVSGQKSLLVSFLGSLTDRDRTKAPFCIKYDGTLLVYGAPSVSPDSISVTNWTATSSQQSMGISVYNKDTGWGDDYNPTDDEVKAYFLGWKMYTSGNSNPLTSLYNGTGTKAWVKIGYNTSSGLMETTTNLPTGKGFIKGAVPYLFAYRPTTPVEEYVAREGDITLTQGSNTVEVGTGLIIGEPMEPALLSITSTYYLNYDDSIRSSRTKYRLDRFIRIFRNELLDHWIMDSSIGYEGRYAASLPYSRGDSNSNYRVDYIAIDKGVTTSIDLTLSTNQRAIMSEAVEQNRQNATRLSSLENRINVKAKRTFLKPSLLNGWVPYSQGYYEPTYYKDHDGMVYLGGLLRGGAVASETTLFILPDGYRPKYTRTFTVVSPHVDASLYVDSAGNVRIASTDLTDNTFLSIDGIYFLAGV